MMRGELPTLGPWVMRSDQSLTQRSSSDVKSFEFFVGAGGVQSKDIGVPCEVGTMSEVQ